MHSFVPGEAASRWLRRFRTTEDGCHGYLVKDPRTQAMIEAAGATLLFLPLYIPASSSTSLRPWRRGPTRSKGYFAKLTRRRLKRGVFRSIVELQAAINRFIEDAKRPQDLRLVRRSA